MKRTSREEDKFMLERVEDFKPTMEGLEDEEVMIGTTAASPVSSSGEKKRRLSNDQIKTLEKNFTLENKLEPETKTRLAVELGLQPRQIAIWFQNRRARWKTKQLERNYGVLKAKYDGLRVDYDALKHGNQALLDQINELKSKLATDEKSSIGSAKEEPLDTNNSNSLTHVPKLIVVNQQSEEEQKDDEAEQTPLFYKDMSTDIDSSAILNTPYHQVKKEEAEQQLMFMDFNSIPCFPQQQELMVFGEELCSSSAFSYELPPSLSWFCSEQWQL